MHLVAVFLLTTAAWPLMIAYWETAGTTLRSSVIWCGGAWAIWLLGLGAREDSAYYFAISLSGCAGVAVLGARRPGVGAWNFVVTGLLAVLLLPVAHGWGTPRVEAAQWVFIGATLTVPVLNYLPTRLVMAVLLCGLGCATELVRLTGTTLPGWMVEAGRLCLGLGPWMGLLLRRRRPASSLLDRMWLGYRDSFGFVWGQRAREQFNRAAINSGWAVRLTWNGLERRSSGFVPGENELLQTLGAVLKRFGTA